MTKEQLPDFMKQDDAAQAIAIHDYLESRNQDRLNTTGTTAAKPTTGLPADSVQIAQEPTEPTWDTNTLAIGKKMYFDDKTKQITGNEVGTVPLFRDSQGLFTMVDTGNAAIFDAYTSLSLGNVPKNSGIPEIDPNIKAGDRIFLDVVNNKYTNTPNDGSLGLYFEDLTSDYASYARSKGYQNVGSVQIRPEDLPADFVSTSPPSVADVQGFFAGGKQPLIATRRWLDGILAARAIEMEIADVKEWNLTNLMKQSSDKPVTANFFAMTLGSNMFTVIKDVITGKKAFNKDELKGAAKQWWKEVVVDTFSIPDVAALFGTTYEEGTSRITETFYDKTIGGETTAIELKPKEYISLMYIGDYLRRQSTGFMAKMFLRNRDSNNAINRIQNEVWDETPAMTMAIIESTDPKLAEQLKKAGVDFPVSVFAGFADNAPGVISKQSAFAFLENSVQDQNNIRIEYLKADSPEKQAELLMKMTKIYRGQEYARTFLGNPITIDDPGFWGYPEKYQKYLEARARFEIYNNRPMTRGELVSMQQNFVDPMSSMFGSVVFDPLNALDFMSAAPILKAGMKALEKTGHSTRLLHSISGFSKIEGVGLDILEETGDTILRAQRLANTAKAGEKYSGIFGQIIRDVETLREYSKGLTDFTPEDFKIFTGTYQKVADKTLSPAEFDRVAKKLKDLISTSPNSLKYSKVVESIEQNMNFLKRIKNSDKDILYDVVNSLKFEGRLATDVAADGTKSARWMVSPVGDSLSLSDLYAKPMLYMLFAPYVAPIDIGIRAVKKMIPVLGKVARLLHADKVSAYMKMAMKESRTSVMKHLAGGMGDFVEEIIGTMGREIQKDISYETLISKVVDDIYDPLKDTAELVAIDKEAGMNAFFELLGKPNATIGRNSRSSLMKMIPIMSYFTKEEIKDGLRKAMTIVGGKSAKDFLEKSYSKFNGNNTLAMKAYTDQLQKFTMDKFYYAKAVREVFKDMFLNKTTMVISGAGRVEIDSVWARMKISNPQLASITRNAVSVFDHINMLWIAFTLQARPAWEVFNIIESTFRGLFAYGNPWGFAHYYTMPLDRIMDAFKSMGMPFETIQSFMGESSSRLITNEFIKKGWTGSLISEAKRAAREAHATLWKDEFPLGVKVGGLLWHPVKTLMNFVKATNDLFEASIRLRFHFMHFDQNLKRADPLFYKKAAATFLEEMTANGATSAEVEHYYKLFDKAVGLSKFDPLFMKDITNVTDNISGGFLGSLFMRLEDVIGTPLADTFGENRIFLQSIIKETVDYLETVGVEDLRANPQKMEDLFQYIGHRVTLEAQQALYPEQLQHIIDMMSGVTNTPAAVDLVDDLSENTADLIKKLDEDSLTKPFDESPAVKEALTHLPAEVQPDNYSELKEALRSTLVSAEAPRSLTDQTVMKSLERAQGDDVIKTLDASNERDKYWQAEKVSNKKLETLVQEINDKAISDPSSVASDVVASINKAQDIRNLMYIRMKDWILRAAPIRPLNGGFGKLGWDTFNRMNTELAVNMMSLNERLGRIASDYLTKGKLPEGLSDVTIAEVIRTAGVKLIWDGDQITKFRYAGVTFNDRVNLTNMLDYFGLDHDITKAKFAATVLTSGSAGLHTVVDGRLMKTITLADLGDELASGIQKANRFILPTDLADYVNADPVFAGITRHAAKIQYLMNKIREPLSIQVGDSTIIPIRTAIGVAQTAVTKYVPDGDINNIEDVYKALTRYQSIHYKRDLQALEGVQAETFEKELGMTFDYQFINGKKMNLTVSESAQALVKILNSMDSWADQYGIKDIKLRDVLTGFYHEDIDLRNPEELNQILPGLTYKPDVSLKDTIKALQMTIVSFKGANASTAIHEFGHATVNLMRMVDRQLNDVTLQVPQLRNDLKALDDWALDMWKMEHPGAIIEDVTGEAPEIAHQAMRAGERLDEFNASSLLMIKNSYDRFATVPTRYWIDGNRVVGLYGSSAHEFHTLIAAAYIKTHPEEFHPQEVEEALLRLRDGEQEDLVLELAMGRARKAVKITVGPRVAEVDFPYKPTLTEAENKIRAMISNGTLPMREKYMVNWGFGIDGMYVEDIPISRLFGPDEPQMISFQGAKATVTSAPTRGELDEIVMKGFEKYMFENYLPTKQVQPIFLALKNMLAKVYNNIKGYFGKIQLNDAVKDVFSRMMGEVSYNKEVNKLIEFADIKEIPAGLPKTLMKSLDDLHASEVLADDPNWQLVKKLEPYLTGKGTAIENVEKAHAQYKTTINRFQALANTSPKEYDQLSVAQKRTVDMAREVIDRDTKDLNRRVSELQGRIRGMDSRLRASLKAVNPIEEESLAKNLEAVKAEKARIINKAEYTPDTIEDIAPAERFFMTTEEEVKVDARAWFRGIMGRSPEPHELDGAILAYEQTAKNFLADAERTNIFNSTWGEFFTGNDEWKTSNLPTFRDTPSRPQFVVKYKTTDRGTREIIATYQYPTLQQAIVKAAEMEQEAVNLERYQAPYKSLMDRAKQSTETLIQQQEANSRRGMGKLSTTTKRTGKTYFVSEETRKRMELEQYRIWLDRSPVTTRVKSEIKYMTFKEALKRITDSINAKGLTDKSYNRNLTSTLIVNDSSVLVDQIITVPSEMVDPTRVKGFTEIFGVNDVEFEVNKIDNIRVQDRIAGKRNMGQVTIGEISIKDPVTGQTVKRTVIYDKPEVQPAWTVWDDTRSTKRQGYDKPISEWTVINDHALPNKTDQVYVSNLGTYATKKDTVVHITERQSPVYDAIEQDISDLRVRVARGDLNLNSKITGRLKGMPEGLLDKYYVPINKNVDTVQDLISALELRREQEIFTVGMVLAGAKKGEDRYVILRGPKQLRRGNWRVVEPDRNGNLPKFVAPRKVRTEKEIAQTVFANKMQDEQTARLVAASRVDKMDKAQFEIYLEKEMLINPSDPKFTEAIELRRQKIYENLMQGVSVPPSSVVGYDDLSALRAKLIGNEYTPAGLTEAEVKDRLAQKIAIDAEAKRISASTKKTRETRITALEGHRLGDRVTRLGKDGETQTFFIQRIIEDKGTFKYELKPEDLSKKPIVVTDAGLKKWNEPQGHTFQPIVNEKTGTWRGYIEGDGTDLSVAKSSLLSAVQIGDKEALSKLLKRPKNERERELFGDLLKGIKEDINSDAADKQLVMNVVGAYRDEAMRLLNDRPADKPFKNLAEIYSFYKSKGVTKTELDNFGFQDLKVLKNISRDQVAGILTKMKPPEDIEGMINWQTVWRDVKESRNIFESSQEDPLTQLLNYNPQFLRWFNGSVVTMENGDPRILIHGNPTGAEFDTFNPHTERGDWGMHFGSQSQAEERVRLVRENTIGPDFSKEATYYPVVLSLQNPLVLKFDPINFNSLSSGLRNALYDESINLSDEERKLISDIADDMDNRMWPGMDKASKQAVYERVLNERGYDGIQYTNDFEDRNGWSYMTWIPSKVKSVSNQGQWGTFDPNIAYQTVNQSDLFKNASDDLKAFWDMYVTEERFGGYSIENLATAFADPGTVSKDDPSSFLGGLRKFRDISEMSESAGIMDPLISEMEYVYKYIKSVLDGNPLPPPFRAEETINDQLKGFADSKMYSLAQLETTMKGLRDIRDNFQNVVSGDAYTTLQGIPENIRLAFKSAGEKVALDRTNLLYSSMNGGNYEGVDLIDGVRETLRVMLDYSYTSRLDEKMRLVMPFWKYPSRSIPFWVGSMFRHPYMMNLYMRYIRFSEETAKQRGYVTSTGEPLPSLVGYIPIPGTTLWFNPTAPLIYRYIYPELTTQDRADENTDSSMGVSVMRWVLTQAQNRGFALGPLWSMLFKSVINDPYGRGDLKFEIGKLMLPIPPDLIPPWLDRAVLGKIDQLVDPNSDGYFIPQVKWKDLLIERQLLFDTMQQAEGVTDVYRKRDMFTKIANVIRDTNRESHPEWIAARTHLEQDDYYRKLVGAMAGFYFKSIDPRYAEIMRIRDELNLLKKSINDDALSKVFQLDITPEERNAKFKDLRYNDPMGQVYDIYQKINFVVDPVTGKTAYDLRRRQLIAQNFYEDEVSQMYYDARAVANTERDRKLKNLGIPPSKDESSAIWDEWSAQIAKIESNPMYAYAKRPWSTGIATYEQIEDHYADTFWRLMTTTRPVWLKDEDQSYDDYQAQIKAWESMMPIIAKSVLPVMKVIITNDLARGAGKSGYDYDNLLSVLTSNATPEGMDLWRKNKASIYDALNDAWWKSYGTDYQAVFELTGAKRELAVRDFYAKHPEPPTFDVLASLVETNYPGRFTREELQNAVFGREIFEIQEYYDQDVKNASEKNDIWFVLNNATEVPGGMAALREALIKEGGNEDKITVWYDVGGDPSAFVDNAEFMDFHDKLMKAAEAIKLEPPTREQLQERAVAEELNAKFKELMDMELGNGAQILVNTYGQLSYASKKMWKVQAPDKYAIVQEYYNLKDSYAAENAIWAKYYWNPVYQGDDASGRSPAGTTSSYSSGYSNYSRIKTRSGRSGKRRYKQATVASGPFTWMGGRSAGTPNQLLGKLTK